MSNSRQSEDDALDLSEGSPASVGLEAFKDRPSDAAMKFMDKTIVDIKKGLSVPREFSNEILGEPRNDSNSQELRGWRPTCLLCRRPVEWIRDRMEYDRREIVVQMECHGQREEIRCYEGDIRNVRGGLRQLIELRGAFRRAAEEEERRRRQEDDYISSKSQSVQFTIKKKPSFTFTNEIDDLKFDDSEMRAIADKMMAQQMARSIAMMTGVTTTASTPGPSSPRKPTRAELKAMLEAMGPEEGETKSLDIERDRVIRL